MLRAIVTLFLLSSCATSPRTDLVFIKSPQHYFVRDSHLSEAQLNAVVDAAIAGDDIDVARLISLAQFTDGERALNFGGLLAGLERVVGATCFSRALALVPEEARSRASRSMAAAKRMRMFVQRRTA